MATEKVILIGGPFHGGEIEVPADGKSDILVGMSEDLPMSARYHRSVDGVWRFRCYERVQVVLASEG